MASVEILNAPPAQLGECPVWDHRANALLWTDISNKTVYRWDASRDETTRREIEGRVGSFVLTDEPGVLVLACETDLMRYDWDDRTTTGIINLEPPGTGNRLNDGRCDPVGRFVVGSMYEDTSVGKATGILHQIGPDTGHRELLRDIGVSNGLAFDAGRQRMYWADSPTRAVMVYDYDPTTGSMGDGRVFFDYGDLAGKPDGACLDSDGGYWSACVHGDALIRIGPDGELSERIELPVKHPTMPCFGGEDLRTLFVTSIADDDHDGPDGSTLVIEGTGATGVTEPVMRALNE